MIPALGAGGREFDSRITPFLMILHTKNKQTIQQKEARCGARTRD
jgi:hypothetical protein